jgi:hypothetical protein
MGSGVRRRPAADTYDRVMTSETLIDVHGVPVLSCAPDGAVLRGDAEATDLVGVAVAHDAELVSVPVERLPDEFFTLRTRVAGEIVQKFVNYRLRLVIVGDISGHLAASSALRDFVAESNRGRQLWFVTTAKDLEERLRVASRP